MAKTLTVRRNDGDEITTAIDHSGCAVVSEDHTVTNPAEHKVGRRVTTLSARRVLRGPYSKADYDSGERVFDQTQISVKVATIYESGRMVEVHGSLSLNPTETEWLIAQLSAAKPPKGHVDELAVLASPENLTHSVTATAKWPTDRLRRLDHIACVRELNSNEDVLHDAISKELEAREDDADERLNPQDEPESAGWTYGENGGERY